MNLPRDPENWTGVHADRTYDRALKLFERYEAKVDLSWPTEKIDELYRPYLLARQEAVDVGRVVGPLYFARAERLP